MRVTRHIALAAGILFTALLVACGGGGDPPASKPPAPTLMSIAVSPGTVSVAKGLTQQFKATGTYSDGSTADVTSQSTWASTVTPVATINAAGLEQSVAPGTSSITATVGTVSGSASLTVTAAVPQSIAITPSKTGLSVRANQLLTTTITYSDGTTADGNGQASWSSSDTSVATVGATTGVVVGVAAGSTQITATIGTITSPPASVYVVTSTWTSTGSLNAARYNHTATLLASGKVFVAGGDTAYSTHPALGSWELYDPAAGTWSTDSLVAPRSRHSATLLSDGRVLIVGGDEGVEFETNPYASAEIYDPSTGTSTATGGLLTPRSLHTATLLADGKVLVAGGQTTGTTDPQQNSTAELYDPVSGTFVATNSELNPHVGATGILLANGKVLVVAGDGQTPPTAELYDPTSQTWTATGSLAVTFYTSLSGATATLLGDGTILLAGGSAATSSGGAPASTATAELYSPTSNTWTATGSLNIARSSHAATLLANGRVLVTGGRDASGNITPTAEVYDPATGIWSLTANLPLPLTAHTATLLANGQVLVVGGSTPGVLAVENAELYSP